MAFCARCGKELPAGVAFCPNCGAPVGADATASSAPSTPDTGFTALTKDQKVQEYWVQRLVAFIIDAIIIYAALAVIFFFAAFSLFFGGFGFAFFFGYFAFLWGLIFVLYFTVLESAQGATIGKRIFQLKVVSKTGSNPNFAEGFVRNLSKIYWLLLLLDVIVGLALSKGYQQKYSDQLMGTKVVHV
jgi:uncharacterized RDD family membrane protein YckC